MPVCQGLNWIPGGNSIKGTFGGVAVEIAVEIKVWLLNSQKIYFKPNWINRGATDVWVMTPKVAVPKVVPGLANCG
jgi:hypothetical protein